MNVAVGAGRVNWKYKVLFITVVPSPYQRDLFEALAARDEVDIKVCYMESTSSENPWPEKPLRPFERILPGFWVPFRGTRAYVNWGIPDLSQTHLVVLSTYTSLTGQRLMRTELRGRRWLFWGERLNRNVGWKGITQRALTAPISHASGIVGIGRAAEEDYCKRFPHVPQFCIPYHCDLSEFLSLRRRPEENAPLTFLFCGQMILRKGVDLLLLAFDRLIARGFDVRLLLVGREADLPKFLELVRPATRSKICYAGFQAPERLPEYFGKGDVFVLPSRHDGWGVVVNQALAAGLPIITSDAVGAGLDLVEDGINGMRVSANDAEALYAAMEAFARNRSLACEWGRRSREKAPDVASKAGAEKWVRVFDKLFSHAC